MKETVGNHATLQRPDGSEVRVHVEDIVIVPAGTIDPESPAVLEFDVPESDPAPKRSIGKMLEDKDKGIDETLPAPGRRKAGAGKLERLAVGMCVAYAQGRGQKKLRLGKVTNITKAENSVVVHRLRPLSDGRLRVRWLPAVNVDAYGADHPSLETLHPRQIMTVVQLHDGVLAHAAARKLDKAGWRLDESPYSCACIFRVSNSIYLQRARLCPRPSAQPSALCALRHQARPRHVHRCRHQTSRLRPQSATG